MLRILFTAALCVSFLAAQSAMPSRVTGEILNAPNDLVVELISTGNHLSTARAFVQPDGRFSLGPVTSGNYELRVSTYKGELLHTEYVEAQTSGNSIQIRLHEEKKTERPVSGLVSLKELTKERRAAMKLMMAATVFREKSQAEKAVQKYEEAIERDPTFALPHHDLAVQFLGMKRPSDARNHLLKAIELDPKLEMAYTNLSIADLALGDPLGAEVSANTALSLNAKDTKASYLKSVSLYLQGRGLRPQPYTKMPTK